MKLPFAIFPVKSSLYTTQIVINVLYKFIPRHCSLLYYSGAKKKNPPIFFFVNCKSCAMRLLFSNEYKYKFCNIFSFTHTQWFTGCCYLFCYLYVLRFITIILPRALTRSAATAALYINYSWYYGAFHCIRCIAYKVVWRALHIYFTLYQLCVLLYNSQWFLFLFL